jgi:hypothetical protein
MEFKTMLPQAITACFAAACLSSAAAAPASTDANALQRVEKLASELAADMARLCPVADPGDQAAFEACRKGLYADSELKRSLSAYVLWGRQRDAAIPLKDYKLTQFNPDVLSSMYLSLFMFNGKYTVQHVAAEGLYQVRLQTAFRNRLAPGQFPYPFWHEAEKWATYQKANEVLLWVDAKDQRIKVAQFTALGAQPPIQKLTPVAHSFDGQWMWTDAQGKTQPTVTVFDGLLRSDNPYIGKLDGAYKRLALRLREGQCFECHVPNNPDGMKKLVLLQTPMHAAAQIKQVLKTVRRDSMPRDEFGIEKPLDDKTKAALLEEGVAFDKLLDLARQWETNAASATMTAGAK